MASSVLRQRVHGRLVDAKPEPAFDLGVDLHPRRCRVCGCTDDNPCEGGCEWVEEDLCSSCADREVLRT